MEIAYDLAKFNVEFTLNQTVSFGVYKTNSLIDALNAGSEYYAGQYYSHWILNKDKKTIAFTENGNKKKLSLDSPIILLPNTASGGDKHFDGWYTDSSCTAVLTDFASNTHTELYSKYNNDNTKSFKITFDTRGGSPSTNSITAKYLSAVNLPRNPIKSGYLFACWETEAGYRMPWIFTMPNHGVTLLCRVDSIPHNQCRGACCIF